jgi:antitoxin (DNA-binding transcriptional repressor) of toxin-antitoxin stability system
LLTTYSKSQARRGMRRMRRLLVLVAQGQTLLITQKGKAACLLVQVEATGRTH